MAANPHEAPALPLSDPREHAVVVEGLRKVYGEVFAPLGPNGAAALVAWGGIGAIVDVRRFAAEATDEDGGLPSRRPRFFRQTPKEALR
jgi:hypothetical protein